MKAEYKRDLQNNYLILEMNQEREEDGYGLRMAEQNEIQGLLEFHSSKRDGKRYLHYEITSRQPLESVYERKSMGYRDILNVLTDIRDVMEAMQRYLLEPEKLIFAPEYIFVGADRRAAFCYFPEKTEETGIQVLAEFILKKLAHEDTQAVTLGYQFYQKVCEENFSFGQVWKELIIAADVQREQREGQRPLGQNQDEKWGREGLAEDGELWNAEVGVKRNLGMKYSPERKKNLGMKNSSDYKRNTEMKRGSEHKQNTGINQSPEYKQNRGMDQRLEYKQNTGTNPDSEYRQEQALEEYSDWNVEYDQEQYEVIHKERKKKKSGKKLDWLFERVHPLVLFSGLFFLAAIEILFYFQVIQLTEAGGMFFLMISVELLVNRFWKNRKEKKHTYGDYEGYPEEDPQYEALREEMYQEEEDSEIGETCCLTSVLERTGIRLIHIAGETREGLYPDICLEKEVLYVGKRKGESDVILNSPTVSRMHARLEGKDGRYFVKDLNSRNGTYCNEERLQPQEQREIAVGDRVAFAQIEYRVVRL